MDEKALEDRALDLVNKGAPWRRDVGWPVIAIEAVVLIGLGIYILVDTEGASDIILQLIGSLLLATSLILGFGSLRRPDARLGFYDAFRAGIGATVGMIALAAWWSDYIEKAAQRSILGWGLLAYTALHLVGLIAVRGRSNIRVSTLVVAALTLILGIILLTGDDEASTSRLNTFAVILLLFGIALGALAYYLYSKTGDGTAGQAAGSTA